MEMPYPADLVRTVAIALGVPEPTVAQHDRNLAVAGIREVRGRGRSARRVSAEDAANLLIAVAAAPISGPSLRESAATVQKYAALASVDHEDLVFSTWSEQLEIPELTRLPEGHSLSSSLAALIRAFVAEAPDAQQGSGSMSLVEVDLMGPRPSARILVITGEPELPEPPPRLEEYELDEVTYERLYAGAPPPTNPEDYPSDQSLEKGQYLQILAFVAAPAAKTLRKPNKGLSERSADQSDGDLQQVRTFTDRTLRALADLLKRDEAVASLFRSSKKTD